MNKLAAEVRARQADGVIAGLLFGVAEKHLTHLQLFKPFPAPGRKSSQAEGFEEVIKALLEASQADPEIAGRKLIGWYSAKTGAAIDQNDTAFHDRYFGGFGDVALLLAREEEAGLLLRVYARSAEGLLSTEEHRHGELRLPANAQPAGPVQITLNPKGTDQLYLRAYEVTKSLDQEERGGSWKGIVQSTKRIALSGFSQKSPASADIENPMSQPEGEHALQLAIEESRDSFAQRVQAWAATLERVERSGKEAPVSARPGTLQPPHAGESPNLPDGERRRRPLGLYAAVSAIAVLPIFAAWYLFRPTPRNNDLDLRAESKGENIVLSWNPQNPIVQSATGGNLEIDDGIQRREVHLDAEQVANGSLLYRPASDDVTFRIELRGHRGAAIRQTMRVLNGEKRQSDELSAAKPLVDSPVSLEAPVPLPVEHFDAKSVRQLWHSLPEPIRLPESRPSITPDASASSQKGAQTPLAAASMLKATAAPNPGTVPAPALNPQLAVNAPPADVAGQIASDSRPASREFASQPALALPQFEPGDLKPLPNSSQSLTEAPAPREMPPAQTAPVNKLRANVAAYVPPKPLRQYMPNPKPWVIASPSEIAVQVKLDENGHVEAARLVRQDGKLPGGLVGAALASAKQWTFKPATLRGKNVESEDTIVFRFRPMSP